MLRKIGKTLLRIGFGIIGAIVLFYLILLITAWI